MSTLHGCLGFPRLRVARSQQYFQHNYISKTTPQKEFFFLNIPKHLATGKRREMFVPFLSNCVGKKFTRVCAQFCFVFLICINYAFFPYCLVQTLSTPQNPFPLQIFTICTPDNRNSSVVHLARPALTHSLCLS